MRRMPDRKRPTPFLLWAPLTCAVQRFKVPDRLKEVGYNGQAWEAGGAGAPLAEYPTDRMKSETHYRPWWSLDAPNEDDVGFGVAKSAAGIWYVVALAGTGDK